MPSIGTAPVRSIYEAPFTYELMLQSAVMNTQAHEQMMDRYEQLSLDADKWANLLDPERDRRSYLMYLDYSKQLSQQSELLAKNGIKGTSRVALNNLRRSYNQNILPINQMWELRSEERKMQMEMQAKDPSTIFSYRAGDRSIDDYMNSPGQSFQATSGLFILNTVAAQAAQLAKQMNSDPLFARLVLGGQWFEYVLQMGFSPDAVLLAVQNSNDPRAPQILTDMIGRALEQSGVTQWGDDMAMWQAESYAKNGLFAAIGAAEQKLILNLDFISRAQQHDMNLKTSADKLQWQRFAEDTYMGRAQFDQRRYEYETTKRQQNRQFYDNLNQADRHFGQTLDLNWRKFQLDEDQFEHLINTDWAKIRLTELGMISDMLRSMTKTGDGKTSGLPIAIQTNPVVDRNLESKAHDMRDAKIRYSFVGHTDGTNSEHFTSERKLELIDELEKIEADKNKLTPHSSMFAYGFDPASQKVLDLKNKIRDIEDLEKEVSENASAYTFLDNQFDYNPVQMYIDHVASTSVKRNHQYGLPGNETQVKERVSKILQILRLEGGNSGQDSKYVLDSTGKKLSLEKVKSLTGEKGALASGNLALGFDTSTGRFILNVDNTHYYVEPGDEGILFASKARTIAGQLFDFSPKALEKLPWRSTEASPRFEELVRARSRMSQAEFTNLIKPWGEVIEFSERVPHNPLIKLIVPSTAQGSDWYTFIYDTITGQYFSQSMKEFQSKRSDGTRSVDSEALMVWQIVNEFFDRISDK